MTAATDEFIEAVRSYVGAGERLIGGITSLNVMHGEALEDLLGGMALTESCARRDSAGWSRQISALLEEFETCRRTVRETAAVALVEEGRSVTDVGRAFGTTHQWASRLLKGADRTDVADGVDAPA